MNTVSATIFPPFSSWVRQTGVEVRLEVNSDDWTYEKGKFTRNSAAGTISRVFSDLGGLYASTKAVKVVGDAVVVLCPAVGANPTVQGLRSLNGTVKEWLSAASFVGSTCELVQIERPHNVSDVAKIGKKIGYFLSDGSEVAELVAKHGKLPLPPAVGFGGSVAAGVAIAIDTIFVSIDVGTCNMLLKEAQAQAQLIEAGVREKVEERVMAAATGKTEPELAAEIENAVNEKARIDVEAAVPPTVVKAIREKRNLSIFKLIAKISSLALVTFAILSFVLGATLAPAMLFVAPVLMAIGIVQLAFSFTAMFYKATREHSFYEKKPDDSEVVEEFLLDTGKLDNASSGMTASRLLDVDLQRSPQLV